MSGRKIIDGMREAVAYAKSDSSMARGRVVHVPEHVDVKAIRKRMHLSQIEFAARYGFSIDSVRNWEQGRRFPDGAARVLLKVIECRPEAVEEALSRSAVPG